MEQKNNIKGSKKKGENGVNDRHGVPNKNGAGQDRGY